MKKLLLILLTLCSLTGYGQLSSKISVYTTDHTLVFGDVNNGQGQVIMNKSSAATVVLSPDATTDFADGTTIAITQGTADSVILSHPGVTVLKCATCKDYTRGQYTILFLQKTKTADTWISYGTADTGSGGGGGSSTFVDLSDGPGAFTGASLNFTQVNPGETALRYRTPTQVASDIGVPLLTSFVDNETPSGTINGSNTAFTIANTPVSGSVAVYKNGLRQTLTTDYTISGTTITFVVAPSSGAVLKVDYRR